MNIDLINKKRKQITLLSVSLTVLFFIVFLLLEFLFAFTYWWMFIVGIAFLITSLYLESKYIIKPKYNRLVLSMIESTFKDRYKDYKFDLFKNKDSFLYYLFHKDYLTFENNIEMSNGLVNISFSDVSYLKKQNKGSSDTFFAKSIKLSFKEQIFNNEAYISENKAYSELFSNFLKDKYKNNEHFISSSRKFNKFEGFYDDNKNYSLIDKLEDTNEFCFIRTHEKEIDLFIIMKDDGFNFKLNEPIRNDVEYYIKEKYSLMFKIIDKLIKE